MIQVLGKYISPSELEIITTEKVGGKIQCRIVHSPAEMHRLYYFWVRNYIFERMAAFLAQRIRAYQLAGPGYQAYESSASDLLYKLRNLQYSTCAGLYHFVLSNEETITVIAPGEKSNHYKYYSSTIRSIIEFCKDPEGEFVV